MTKIDPQGRNSYIVNGAVYVKHDEQADYLFNFPDNSNGMGIIKLDGYMVCPMDMFSQQQIEEALEKYYQHGVASRSCLRVEAREEVS